MNPIPWRSKRDKVAAKPVEAPLVHLRDEIDAVMDRFFGNFWEDPWNANPLASFPAALVQAPRVDLAESDDEITVKAELPGVDADDLEINVVGDTLTIRGEKKEEKAEKKENYHFTERRFGSFSRSIPLPSSADPEKVDATFKKGVLTVTIGKRPDAKPTRVKVKSG